MKLAAFLLAAFLVCVLPVLLAVPFTNEADAPIATTTPTELATTPVPVIEDLVMIYDEGIVRSVPVEAYITCVVLAEMPASFEMEALKAQAVVARTYTYRRIEQPKHNEAAVCTDAACCQAYISVVDYIADGGTMDSVNRIAQAVTETSGRVMTYQGTYIEATYFSCSGGRTEDAAAVWGSDVPYLQSVDSPGEENATHYTDTVRLTAKEFCEKIGYQPSGPVETWVGQVRYTKGGGVSDIQIGEKTFSGTNLRKCLNLRSTAFVVTAVGDMVTITTKGFGHRVGMSQYGADAMAVMGSSYQEILCHYYQGAELTNVAG